MLPSTLYSRLTTFIALSERPARALLPSSSVALPSTFHPPPRRSEQHIIISITISISTATAVIYYVVIIHTAFVGGVVVDLVGEQPPHSSSNSTCQRDRLSEPMTTTVSTFLSFSLQAMVIILSAPHLGVQTYYWHLCTHTRGDVER